MTDTIRQRSVKLGFTRGFDYLRIILALSVLVWHSAYISGDEALYYYIVDGPWGILKMLVLPMFFALSGFLVTGSLERSRSLEDFLALRAVRLLPALAVEVTLSALILGPILTHLPLSEYFSSRGLYTYFLNIAGYIHYYLPGVFFDNPRPRIVNLSLWTVPYELECYLSLTLVAVLGMVRRQRRFLLAVLVAWLGMWAVDLVITNGVGVTEMTAPGRLLVICFLFGVLINLYGDRIPFSAPLALLSLVLALAALSFDQTKWLSALPAAYLTVWLGMLNPPKIPVLMDGDYSYGLYLFAYPIQQALAMQPAFQPWHINALWATVLGLIYAGFSWHVVESPILARKKFFVTLAEDRGKSLRAWYRSRRPAPAA